MKAAKYPAYKQGLSKNIRHLPEHWAELPLKRVFRLEKREPLESDEIVTAFRDGTVTLRKNKREDGFTNALKEIGYQRIRRNDLVIHAMDAFAGAIGVSDSDGKSSPVYSACTATKDDSPHYYAYYLRDLALHGFIESLAKGIRERSTDFRWSDASMVSVPVPPRSEQLAIVSFLDRETAKIDALIAEQQRLIELLQEKRQAIISHAVTKGLNPNAPMKDSGVEWLGQVPEHWDTKSLKYIVRMKSGDFITSDSIETEGAYPVFGGNGLRGFTDDFNREGAYALIGRQGALCGNVNAASGRFWASEHAIVCIHQNETDLAWLCNMLEAANLNQYSTSAAQPGLSVEVIGNTKVPCPPPSEQVAIGAWLEQELSKMDATIETANHLIAVLGERRSALISAAVTGQIDVRGLVEGEGSEQ